MPHSMLKKASMAMEADASARQVLGRKPILGGVGEPIEKAASEAQDKKCFRFLMI